MSVRKKKRVSQRVISLCGCALLLGMIMVSALTETTEIVADATQQELPADGLKSYLSFADQSWEVQYWEDGNDYSPVICREARVDGYGQYTVKLDFSGVDGGMAANMQFLDVEIENGEAYFPNCYMQIDAVKINDEEVEVADTYTGSADGTTSCTYLYNPWAEANKKGRVEDAELTDCTAKAIAGDTFTDIETIEVTYTLVEGKDSEVDSTDASAYASNEYPAHLVFADGNGIWDSTAAGIGTDCTVIGDGIYEVSLTAEQCGAQESAIPDEDQLLFYLNISGLAAHLESEGLLEQDTKGRWMKTDLAVQVAVYVDGTRINTKNLNIKMGDVEKNGNLQIDLWNALDGTGTKDAPVVMASALIPSKEIKVIFSLSGTGLNTEGDTDLDTYIMKTEAEDTFASSNSPVKNVVTTVKDENRIDFMVVTVVLAVIGMMAVLIHIIKKKQDR